MDHHIVYYQIVSNARDRDITPGHYYEQHHIIPRSLGGDNSASNLINLTPREHFICHALLVKMHSGPDRHKMLYAFNAMRMHNIYQSRVTSRLYAYFKHELYSVYSQKMIDHNPMHNPTHKWAHLESMKTRKMIGMTGRKHSESTKQRMRDARKKQIITDETKLKLREHRKKASTDPNYINGCRIGWYITPWGRFKSLKLASQNQPCTQISIKNWCRINNTMKLSATGAARCSLFSKEDVGKTYAELGFGFEDL